MSDDPERLGDGLGRYVFAKSLDQLAQSFMRVNCRCQRLGCLRATLDNQQHLLLLFEIAVFELSAELTVDTHNQQWAFRWHNQSHMFSRRMSFLWALVFCKSRLRAANASVGGRFASANIPSSSTLKALKGNRQAL